MLSLLTEKRFCPFRALAIVYFYNLPQGVALGYALIGLSARNFSSYLQPGIGDLQPGINDLETGIGDLETGIGDLETGIGDLESPIKLLEV